VSLNLEAKKAIVKEIAEIAGNSPSAVAAEYTGLTVSDMTELRQSARDAGVYLRVVRNTLARRALEDTNLVCMREGLVGQLVLAFSKDEPGAAAKVVRDFVKKNDKLVVKLVALEGKLLQPSDIDALASLPSKEQAISMLMGMMTAPVAMLVRTLTEPHTKLVRTVKAVADQKQAA
jgi:large subunit ribosomal protein L10